MPHNVYRCYLKPFLRWFPRQPDLRRRPQKANHKPARIQVQNAAVAPAKVDDYNLSSGKSYRVLAGTVIETVLLNRINSDFSGPVNCMVTSPVYSHDRQRVLLPEGTKVLGEAQKLAALGQKRVALAFHRLIMPDGFSVNLDQFKGLNQIGETALRDKVNNHYFRIFGMSVALGLISGFSNRGVTLRSRLFGNRPLSLGCRRQLVSVISANPRPLHQHSAHSHHSGRAPGEGVSHQ